MVDFNDIKYERVNYDEIKENLNSLISSLNDCNDFVLFKDICKKIVDIQNMIEEMADYADIRNMRDLNDQYFNEEMAFWNKYKPKFDLLFLPFYQIILNCQFKERIREVMTDNFISTIEYQFKITNEQIIELQQKENVLKQKYRQLNKNKIIYDNEERSRMEIVSLFSNKDRNIRKKAHDAVNDYYYSKQKEYDEILYELVKVRNEIAIKLGFDNYKTYSLYKQRRFGYNYDDIDKFRNSIIKYVIPLCKRFSEWQKENLHLKKLEYYDTIFFEEEPNILFTGKGLLQKIGEALGDNDPELKELIQNMIKYNYIDLETRDNKITFYITNYLTTSCLPTITGTFKNNYLDAVTASHEIGHAFQKYCASLKDKEHIVSALLKYPTMEIAETFSKAMELIGVNSFASLFSKDDYLKYCFKEIYDFVSCLPYTCLVDEFQEQLYSKENLEIEDIRKIWLDLVKKYNLETSNSGHINLLSGGYFYRQTHIYTDPFYFIDYALSSFLAFAIWNESKENLNLFKEIASVASYYSFKDLILKYQMPNPFVDEVVKETVEKLEKELIELRTMIK